ncbi:MAG: hypothetical protein J6Q61_02785 [Bacteroidales bacterium]|nr:hypothetical protein [Bacteroidales bacterium]MBO5853643.1 hypothetical protein [Bacteroidales bacterium]
MAVTFCPQFSFTGGQLDANITQRGDLQQYYRGLKKAENVMLKLTGGAKRRYGTKLLRAAPATNVRQEFRIIDFSGTNANGVTFTRLIVFGENTADVYNVDTNAYLCSFATGKTAELMSQCDYETDRNKIIFVHETVAPFAITWTNEGLNAGDYSIANLPLVNLPNYEFVANDKTGTTLGGGNLTPSGVTGYVTLTASTGTPFANTNISPTATDADWEGKKIVISPVGVVRIVSKKSNTVVLGYVERRISSTDAIPAANWVVEIGWEPIISATRGYPKTIAFYASRMYLGGTKSIPNLLMASTIEDNYDFDLGDASDNDGFYELLDSRDSAHIYMLQSRNTLEIYCNESVYVLSTTGFISPVNVKVTRASSVGIVQRSEAPLVSDGGSMYINNDENGIYYMSYVFDAESYTSQLISELAASMVSCSDSTFNTTVWKGNDEFKNNFFVYIDKDDNLVFITILLNQEIRGFSKQIFRHNGNNSKVYAVYAAKNKLYLIKDSGLAGSYDLVCLDQTCFLDSSVTATAAAGELTGLTRHASTTVDAILVENGSYLGQFDVDAAGKITLGTADYNGKAIEVGYGFVASIDTLPVENIQQIGSSIGKEKIISEVFVNPESIANMTINGYTIVDKDNSSAVDTSFVNRTQYGWSREQTIRISQTKPLALSIRNIQVKAEVNA